VRHEQGAEVLKEVRVTLDRYVLARTITFDDLGEALGTDLRHALTSSLEDGAVHPAGTAPLDVFQAGLAIAIGSIDGEARNTLFLRFLRDGPYQRPGRFLRRHAGACLSDAETVRVLRFICGHMISSFQGFLAECLGAGALTQWLREEKRVGTLPSEARLFLGDSVMAARPDGQAPAKAADAYVLTVPPDVGGVAQVHAVVEIKSYRPRAAAIREQLALHVSRARRGLIVGPRGLMRTGVRRAYHVIVRPSDWRLPHSLDSERALTSRAPDTEVPAEALDSIHRNGPGEVEVRLRWSREALASVAYSMTHWYMSKVGEAVWAEARPPWLEMSPGDAGRNAAKEMLYYAILRVRTRHDWAKAVGLYNTFAFGYALGMSFRDRKGVRQMMWPEDLVEIERRGFTNRRCRFR